MGEFDYSKLPEDPGLRPNILSYPPNVRDQVRRYYLMKGPCQPKNHSFPLTKKGNDHASKFNPCWFMDHASWLEYSIAKDRLFCLQLNELDDRFTEATTDLLLCVACLNPSDSFYAFYKDSLVRLAQFYPRDFSEFDLVLLDNQLQSYIIDMRSSVEFSGLNGITYLARIMFKTKKDKVYPSIYKLLTLALILPVATASVERLFSAIKILKNRLHNRMGDEWMNDCLLAYAERDILDNITDDMIMWRFQKMKKSRGRLPLNMETS